MTTLLIALGFRVVTTASKKSSRCFTGLFDAASYLDLRRLPELFCGFQRSRGPRAEPFIRFACSPQAWASATPFTLFGSLTRFGSSNIGAGEIRLRNPRLPAFLLKKSFLRNLGLGRSNVDLRVSRRNKGASVEILRGQGDIQISVILSQ